MTDNDRTVQVPVSLPTREQIAEVLYSFSGDWQLYRIPWRKQAHDGVRKALLDRADAVITFLLSQPTPTAELPATYRQGYDDGYMAGEHDARNAETLPTAEPPRIEDMAPGREDDVHDEARE